MDDPHGNITITDVCLGVGDFFIELVSSIGHGSYKSIKVIMVRKLNILIVVSGVCVWCGIQQWCPLVHTVPSEHCIALRHGFEHEAKWLV